MSFYGGPIAECPIEEGCLAWAHKYLKDCVCDSWDEVSLILGLLSVFSWGVAEVPQILTNFREKSTEGVSLAFLMTWVLGDAFNLAGCYMEPATLPTQFYMAVLYTITTIVLVGQTIYYDYLYLYFHPELEYEPIEDSDEKPKPGPGEEPRPIPTTPSSSPASTINVPHSRRGSTKDLYYMSARSLASSFTPTVGSYLVGSRESGGQHQSFLRPSQGSVTGGLSHLEQGGTHSHTASPSPNTGSLGTYVRSAGASVLLVGSVGLSSNFLSAGSSGLAQTGGRQAFLTARRLLQATGRYSRPGVAARSYIGEEAASGPWGEIFGWCMAAIYMGGRLPQILLNIRRGTVEGLNPLMFVFALVGNATYVGSILVRTLEWTNIKPNMPWLVDAGVCVLLDAFIICQFFYYTYYVVNKKESSASDEEESKKGGYDRIAAGP